MKFAFIINLPGESPETCARLYENEEAYDLFVASGDMDMAQAMVKKYAADGFSLINLCGDFTAEQAKQFELLGNGKLKVYYADYFPEELAKLEALSSLKEYGIISITDGLKNTESFQLLTKECNTTVMLVSNLESAKQAACDLEKRGVFFIELCSWFDAEKTKAVIEAVGGRLPVGSCGIHL